VHLETWKVAPTNRRQLLLFAVLAHDFGKPVTTSFADRRGQLRWISPGHESAGAPLAETFLTRIGAPLDLAPHVRPLVALHLAHHSGQGEFSDNRVRRLARRLSPATIEDLCIVMRADHDGRPPLHSPETLARIEELRARATTLSLTQSAPKPILLGRHLLALGLPPGPAFKKLLDAAFEAQLDGVFIDESGGLKWLKNHLPAPHAAS
jgi:tRNA nucleotidyltransferase (CCA-adding enzyme)